jgi:hypothetical protein
MRVVFEAGAHGTVSEQRELVYLFSNSKFVNIQGICGHQTPCQEFHEEGKFKKIITSLKLCL